MIVRCSCSLFTYAISLLWRSRMTTIAHTRVRNGQLAPIDRWVSAREIPHIETKGKNEAELSTCQEVRVLGLVSVAETTGPDQPRLPRARLLKILVTLHVNIDSDLLHTWIIRPPAMSSLVSRHTIRQLEYILPGALITYYYGTISEFLQILSENSYGNLVQGGWLAR